MEKQSQQISNPDYTQELIATLGFLQSLTARMATMSTVCKICAATIFAGLGAAALASGASAYFWGLLIITGLCAWLDSFYLQKERESIVVYNRLAACWRNGKISKTVLFDLTPHYAHLMAVRQKGRPILSHSIWPFYGSLIGLSIVGIIWGGK